MTPVWLKSSEKRIKAEVIFCHRYLSQNVVGDKSLGRYTDTPSKSHQQLSTHRAEPLNVSTAPVNRAKSAKRENDETHAHTEPRLSRNAGEKGPLRVASGLRIPFVATSISCPCGFAHFYYNTADTTEITDKIHQIQRPLAISYLNIIVFTVFRNTGQVLVAFHESSFAGRDLLL